MSDPGLLEEVRQLRADIAGLEQLLRQTLRVASAPAAKLEQEWLSAKEIAAYSGRHYTTVIRALRAKKIKATQADKNASYRAHIDDVKRWMRGEAPLPQNLRQVHGRRSA